MASSVAKLKPLSSVIAEPDEVLVQNMDENEVLIGLAKTSDSTRKAGILDELRANARRNGGRLQFVDRLALFRVLHEALADSNVNTRLRCTEFLCEVIPEFGEDLDNCMALVLPQLVSNIGDKQVSAKKSAIQTLHVYMKHSSQVGAILNAIIDYGIESENRKTRTESLVALPILIMPNLAHEDLFTLTRALVGRLENSSRPESSPAVMSLERIRNVVGTSVFDSYLRRMSPDQEKLCLLALQNRTTDSLKDLEVLAGGRKAKSAGYLNSNGVIAGTKGADRNPVLDRGHTIAVTNNSDHCLDISDGPLEFGFVPRSVMTKLRDESNWRLRAQGIEELKTLMEHLTDMEPVYPNLGSLFTLLLGFLDDANFKIGVTSFQIIGLLVAKLGVGVHPVLKPLLLALSNKLGDNKIVIRQENMKVLMQLMQILSPKAVLSVLTSNLQHRNSKVREETVNVFIAALLKFPSSDFNLPDLTDSIAPALVDSKRRVRLAALEAFAVIAQAMGPGQTQPISAAVDKVELTMGGEGVMGAITARLARRLLPRLNRDGLVEYAIPMPPSGTIRGHTNVPRGADVDWILAGTAGTGSADPTGSARSTPGLNDFLDLSGPSKRFFSAGKNRLPWEGDPVRDGTGNQPDADTNEPIRPPMKVNSWAPTEIVKDRVGKPTHPSRSKPSSSSNSYAEKYHSMNMQRANQVSERHSSKATESTAVSSYAEMHRAKIKKDRSKIGGHAVTLSQTTPGVASSANSYALLYKRGSIGSKTKTIGSTLPESAAGEHAAKESVLKGPQSVTPTPYSLQSSFSVGEEDPFSPSHRRAFPMSLSSSWPDWSEMRPYGRLSPVSHNVPADFETSADLMDGETKKSGVPQTPIHMKPQLARSASKTRGSRAPELGEMNKGEIQSSGVDFLEMSPIRPPQLAPVKVGNVPPQNLLKEVNKQAETKRALKMYSVISDGEDGKSRTPSPSESNDPFNQGIIGSSGRIMKASFKPESPFDSKPRLVRTPVHSRRQSGETSLQPHSTVPSPNKFSDLDNGVLGITGYQVFATQGGKVADEFSPENGVHSHDDKHSKSSVVGSSISGNVDDILDIQGVEVVGQRLLDLDKKHNTAHDKKNPLQYETEESDENFDSDSDSDDDSEDHDGDDDDDDDGDDNEEDEGDEEEVVEHMENRDTGEENKKGVLGREEEKEEEADSDKSMEQEDEESGNESGGEAYSAPSGSLGSEATDVTTTTVTTSETETSTIKSEDDSLESLDDSDEDSDTEVRRIMGNNRDMTPKTLRKSLSKSTRERMERMRQEEEVKLHREQEKLEELERDRSKQWHIQREEEERLRQKILKEQFELGKMLNRKEKERESERQRQQQLQEELQKQEKALRDRLIKQQQELEEIEQEKQREKEQQKERTKERMRQMQKQKELERRKAEAQLKENEQQRDEILKRKRAEKEAALQQKQMQKATESEAESNTNDLFVMGSSSPLKSNRKPPLGGTPKKKMPVSSIQGERDSSYAVTDEPLEVRRHHVASAGSSAASQCWEVSLDELQPFNNPDNALRDALKCLANTEDWAMKCEGIQGIRRLAKHHPEVLTTQLHAVTLAVIAEVKNLRSQVSRSGICCLGDMYSTLGKQMDNELEVTAKILLAKGAESSGFIRDDVDKALTAMVFSLTPTRVLLALISGGASHRNVTVRKTTAQFLSLLSERMGASRLMSGAKDITEKILPTAAQFVTDGGPETRYYGRKILHIMYEHPEFERNVNKHVPSNLQKNVHDTVENLRTKGLGDPPSDLSSSARQRKPATGGGSSRSSGARGSLSPSSNSSSRESSRSGKPGARDGLVQGEEMIPNLINSLQANDWKERQRAVDRFVDLMQLNPDGLGPKFTKVFDAFVPRLQDSNSKVNLHALQCLPKILPVLANQSGALVPPLLSALTSNLASKNASIFSAALEALDELIKNIDNNLLVQPFCTTAQYGSSRVKPILVDKLADMVPAVYSRKPQSISRHVLPLLWNLLNSSSNGSAAANSSAIRTSMGKLTATLHSSMGRALIEQASNQSPKIREKVHEIIGS